MEEEDQPGEVAKLIAKLTDPSTKNDSILPSQEMNPSTPPVSLLRELEEHQSKPAEVTFVEKAAAVSVPNSRRHKSRLAKLSGRTSESLSRDDQAFFLWEESSMTYCSATAQS